MSVQCRISEFRRDDAGGILVFWSFTLVAVLGLAALVVDAGRLATTQSELQSYADSVSLAAAAELDSRPDALTRARAAAETLLNDTQTFATGSRTLSSDDVTLVFYRPDGTGGFTRDAGFVTSDPVQARFAEARIAERQVTLPFSAAMAALSDTDVVNDTVSASAVAHFAVEACDVSPVAMCLPDVGFSAQTAIGESLSLSTSLSAGLTLPGSLIGVSSVSGLLDGLSVCVGLSGDRLDACLLAAQEPETACMGSAGLTISANVQSQNLLDGINTRFGRFNGLVSGLAGDSDFPVAPSLLGGVLDAGGICAPNPGATDIALPLDDCFASGACAVEGNGSWALGRDAYVDAHYDGTDPFPQAQTRFEYYQAEVAAGTGPTRPSSGGGLGGLIGGVVGTLLPQLCVPPTPADPTRRLMVVAGVNCANASNATLPPVQEFFEVFVLGPGENGLLNVEVTACLGGSCGGGHLDTQVQDIVRLVE